MRPKFVGQGYANLLWYKYNQPASKSNIYIIVRFVVNINWYTMKPSGYWINYFFPEELQYHCIRIIFVGIKTS